MYAGFLNPLCVSICIPSLQCARNKVCSLVLKLLMPRNLWSVWIFSWMFVFCHLCPGFFFFLKTWNFFIITDKNVFFHLEKKMEKWRDWKVFFYKILKNSWEKCVFSLWTFSQTWFWSFVFRLMVNFVPFSILCL